MFACADRWAPNAFVNALCPVFACADRWAPNTFVNVHTLAPEWALRVAAVRIEGNAAGRWNDVDITNIQRRAQLT